MEYQLDASHNKYIKVTVSGIIEKVGFIAAISELMQHSEYLNKHSLWDLSNSTVGLTIGDLKEIAGVLRLFKLISDCYNSHRTTNKIPEM